MFSVNYFYLDQIKDYIIIFHLICMLYIFFVEHRTRRMFMISNQSILMSFKLFKSLFLT